MEQPRPRRGRIAPIVAAAVAASLLTAALCAATDGLSPFDRKFSSPTRAQTATLLQKSAE